MEFLFQASWKAPTAKPAESEEAKKKYEALEEEYVTLKAKLTTENEDLTAQLKVRIFGNSVWLQSKRFSRACVNFQTACLQVMQDESDVTQRELKALRQTYNIKADDWIKEKLEVQKKVRDLEDSIRNSAGGEGWEGERERFKHIIEDRDNQITQLKIEGIKDDCLPESDF